MSATAITLVIIGVVITSVVGFLSLRPRTERQSDVPLLPIDHAGAMFVAEDRVGATKSWYRVAMDPGLDAGSSNILLVLQGYQHITVHPQPGEALFVDYSVNPAVVYFSPAAARSAAYFVETLGGVPCKAPSRDTVDFLTGDPKVEQSLPR